MIAQLKARIKNLFVKGEFSHRNNDGSIQVQTRFSRVIDNQKEAFPYGFYTKAKSGTVSILCVAGSFDALQVMPIENTENAPSLEEGDVAI
ncbi:MAG: hypothetical protein ACRC5H_10775, partial [Treponemataceae bacterium]